MILNELPRAQLGIFPTPFYRMESVSAKYGRNVYIKRDDLSGVALGGNKVRKLEFLLAEAQKQGCDVVFTTGGAQSNHAAITAACASRLGMRVVLLLKNRGVTGRRGNLVLNEIFGAEVELMDVDTYEEIYAEMHRQGAEMEKRGHKCCYIPLGGSSPLGCAGYVNAMRELAVQTMAAGVRIDRIVSATGSGGTSAGVLLGAKLFLPGAKVTGIGISEEPFGEIVPQLTANAAELLQCGFIRDTNDFEIIYNVGEGYAIPNVEDTPYIKELARSEGILLDPVYTGKAYAAMCHMIEEGGFGDEENIVFLHTGGAAALFAMDLAEI